MTIQIFRGCLRSLAESIRHLPETLSRSLPLAAAPMGTLPPCNWRDYDVPTFKRRGIRLNIGQGAAHR